MAVYTPLLGLSLPTTGTLAGTWGDEVNNAITSLLDSSIAGTTTLSADADVTLSTTDGAANQARAAVILWTAANGANTRSITAPSHTKAYIVINAGTGSIVVKGAATTGVTIATGVKALIAWNGSDFVVVSASVMAVGSITGLGTGVATALAVNVGTAGAPVVNGGALGTPSSGSLANCTAYPGTSALVTTGALNSGSITSGFGAIDVGTDAITTTGALSGGDIAGGSVGTVKEFSLGMTSTKIRVREGININYGVFSTNISDGGVQDNAGMSSWKMGMGYGNIIDSWSVRRSPAGSASFTTLAEITSTGLNSTVIGATTPAAGSFTTLSASGGIGASGVVPRFTATGGGGDAPGVGPGYAVISDASADQWYFRLNAAKNAAIYGYSVAGGGWFYPVAISSTGLAVTGALSATGGMSVTRTTDGSLLNLNNTGGTLSAGLDNSAGGGFGVGAYSAVLWNSANTPLVFATNNAPKMTLDTSGNLGLGVVPSAWYSGSAFKALQVSTWGSIVGSATNFRIMGNSYYNSAGAPTYLNTDLATEYIQDAGYHKWYSAPSGTAGAAITFTQVLAVEKDKSLALQGATSQTGTGITFPATQNASSDPNTLDDYKEGTFTPSQGAGLAVVGAFSSVGKYTKLGNQVTVSGYVLGATSVANASSGLVFGALPYTVSGEVAGSLAGDRTISGTATLSGTDLYGTAITAVGAIRFGVTYLV